MKTNRTKKLEKLLYNKFNRSSEFFVFECTLGWFGKEIVDCVMYNNERKVYCYEIKQSVADFNSKSKISFFGNMNYYVMPYELYLKVKKDIPLDVGCYVSIKNTKPKKYSIEEWNEYNLKAQKGIYEDGFDELLCIKRASKQELKADKEVILSSMLRSMQNGNNDRISYFNLDKGVE